MAQTSPLSHIKRLYVPLVLMSSISNLAILVTPIFMMQVLDRVVPSENLNTLVLLLGVALAVMALQALVDGVRDGTFQRLARWLESASLPRILAQRAGMQSRIDALASLSNGLRGAAGQAALTLPWIPLFFAALFVIHPTFFVLAIGLVGLLLGAKALSHWRTQMNEKQVAALKSQESAALSNATSFFQLAGMHALVDNLCARFEKFQTQRHMAEEGLTRPSVQQTSVAAFLRSATQLLGLSLGAALVVSNELTAGGMIAASIILSKAVTTCETSLSQIPVLRSLRTAWGDLHGVFEATQQRQTHIAELSGALSCEKLIFPRGGGAPPRLENISFQLKPAECLAIIGASGSGKSTLLSALAGIEPSPIGSVFFDQTEVKTISHASAAVHMGFLSQQARLFDGTIADNICSFDPMPDDDKIVEAAKVAGVHGLISSLPRSYDTDVANEGHLLSLGQMQRVALARAIYSRPRYLFLDEPNALLDAEGERQLADALARLKEQGTTIVMVIHRSGVMGLADKVLLLDNGRIADYGPRNEVLARFSNGLRRIELPLAAHSQQDLMDWVNAQFRRVEDTAFTERTRLVVQEMFNVAIQNGTQDGPRKATFTFAFKGSDTCEIVLTEASETQADHKLSRVTKLLTRPEVDTTRLPADEAALVVIRQVTADLQIENVEGQAIFAATVDAAQSAAPRRAM